jgi:LPXTG-site transpeptidase (sortase) family protein
LSKTVSNSTPQVGSNINFTLTITNSGPDAATGVTVVDVIPSGFAYISDNGSGAYNSSSGIWTVGNLAVNETKSLTITVRVNATGSYTNYAQIRASSLVDPDSTPNNNSANEDDDDSVTVTPTQRNPDGLSKTILDSNQLFTTNPSVAIGEIVTYQVSINVPPGVFTNAQLVDTMDRGLSFMDCVGITDNGLQTSNIAGFSAICSSPVVDDAGGTTTVDVGRRVTFAFGTLTNNTGSNQTLLVRYRAVVLDSAGNVSGTSRDNNAGWMWNAGALDPINRSVAVMEPDISILTTANTSVVSVGSEITITLTIQHMTDGETNAYETAITDTLPAGLQYVPGSLECTSGAQDADLLCAETGGTIAAQWSNFALSGGDGRVSFRVTVVSLPASGITNTANVAWTSLPGDVSAPQNVNVFSTERDYDPGSQINIYGNSHALTLGVPASGGNINNNNAAKAKQLPSTGFAPDQVTDLSNLPREAYAATNEVTIEIPSLGVNLPIVGVPLQNGTWNVSWLDQQAGWLEGSAFPSWKGNSVLTSHVYLATGLPGPFVNVHKLKYGDKVIIHAYGQRYTFEVRSNEIVSPSDTSAFRHEEKAWLTLVTCKEYDEKTNSYRKRVVVRAVLVSVTAD